VLFKFGIFWKTAATVFGVWFFYGAFGFEFTVITLMALMLAFCYKRGE